MTTYCYLGQFLFLFLGGKRRKGRISLGNFLFIFSNPSRRNKNEREKKEKDGL